MNSDRYLYDIIFPSITVNDVNQYATCLNDGLVCKYESILYSDRLPITLEVSFKLTNSESREEINLTIHGLLTNKSTQTPPLEGNKLHLSRLSTNISDTHTCVYHFTSILLLSFGQQLFHIHFHLTLHLYLVR